MVPAGVRCALICSRTARESSARTCCSGPSSQSDFGASRQGRQRPQRDAVAAASRLRTYWRLAKPKNESWDDEPRLRAPTPEKCYGTDRIGSISKCGDAMALTRRWRSRPQQRKLTSKTDTRFPVADEQGALFGPGLACAACRYGSMADCGAHCRPIRQRRTYYCAAANGRNGQKQKYGKGCARSPLTPWMPASRAQCPVPIRIAGLVTRSGYAGGHIVSCPALAGTGSSLRDCCHLE